MIQRWRQTISLALIGVAVGAGVFSGMISRTPVLPNSCADRLLPPKYYMRECVVRVEAIPPISELSPEYYIRTMMYFYDFHKDVCAPSLSYGKEEMYFIFYTHCDDRFGIVNRVIEYMRSNDRSYPYTKIDYDFTVKNDFIKMKNGGSFANDGEWIADFPYRPPKTMMQP